jgi:hypothetical protein
VCMVQATGGTGLGLRAEERTWVGHWQGRSGSSDNRPITAKRRLEACLETAQHLPPHRQPGRQAGQTRSQRRSALPIHRSSTRRCIAVHGS